MCQLILMWLISIIRYCEKPPKHVQIVVGAQRKIFYIPEELICERVDYFKAAFKGGFREGREKRLELIEEDPEVFRYIIDWIFGQSRLKETSSLVKSENPASKVVEKITHFCKLYFLADKLGMRELAKECLPCLQFWITRLLFSGSAITYLYEHTLDSALIRTNIVQAFVELFFDRCYDSYEAVWSKIIRGHPDFQSEVNKGIRAHIGLEMGDCGWRYNCQVLHHKKAACKDITG